MLKRRLCVLATLLASISGCNEERFEELQQEAGEQVLQMLPDSLKQKWEEMTTASKQASEVIGQVNEQVERLSVKHLQFISEMKRILSTDSKVLILDFAERSKATLGNELARIQNLATLSMDQDKLAGEIKSIQIEIDAYVEKMKSASGEHLKSLKNEFELKIARAIKDLDELEKKAISGE